jgi:DivIVA domain-containing protein
MARPGSYAPPVNGGEVRDTWFLRAGGGGHGYDESEVDALLRRVAAELDAGRPAGPLIENATFRERRIQGRGYDIDAVDWFLDQFLLHPVPTEPAGTSADPWRDLAVAQLTRSGAGAAAEPPARQPRNLRKYLARECGNAWHDFGQAPGMHLLWGRAGRGRLWAARYELRTAEQQTIASRDRRPRTVSAGGRSFAYKKTNIRPVDAWPQDLAGPAARSWRDQTGHFAGKTRSSKTQGWARPVGELTDETRKPILYTCGKNFGHRAYACVTFPDQRWLRFWVRGTESGNAIMTAVDQAGNRVARYRKAPGDPRWQRAEVEITVHPDRKLTDELVLTIAISAEWLKSYFSSPGGGAGAGAVGTGGGF